MPRINVSKLSRATTRPTSAPPQVERALAVSGRGLITEQRRQADAARVLGRGTASLAPRLSSMVRPELPVRQNAQGPLGLSTRMAVSPRPVGGLREQLEAGPATAPRFAWLARDSRPATTPMQALANRELRKASAVALGRGAPVLLSQGDSPTDIANGLFTPTRGVSTINDEATTAGAHAALRDAPADSVVMAPRLGRATLGASSPSDEAGRSPEGTRAAAGLEPGGGGERVLFLVAAAFVAWIALKGKA